MDVVDFVGRSLNFIGGILTVSKYNVGLKALLLRGLSGPGFCGGLVYKFRKIIGKDDFPCHFRGIVVRCGGVGYGMDVVRRTACLVVGPVGVGGFTCLFGCATVGRTSD